MNPDMIWNQIDLHRDRIFSGVVRKRRLAPFAAQTIAWKVIRKMYSSGTMDPTGGGMADAERVILILYKTANSEIPPEPFDVIVDNLNQEWRVESVNAEFMNLRFHCFCVKG